MMISSLSLSLLLTRETELLLSIISAYIEIVFYGCLGTSPRFCLEKSIQRQKTAHKREKIVLLDSQALEYVHTHTYTHLQFLKLKS